MGVLFVDDTDLYIMDVCHRSRQALWQDVQDSTTTWGHLLTAIGGALKPVKCFYYLADYKWSTDGSWACTLMVDMPSITVPLPYDSQALIKQLPVDESQKTLGIWTNPAGCCHIQLEILNNVIKVWTDRLCAGRLPTKWAWVSYFQQMWEKLRYGLGVNSSPVSDLE